MIENKNKYTALQIASREGHEEIMTLFLNVFSGKEKGKLIEYEMKKNKDKYTALHISSYSGCKKIVTLLLNVFGKNKNNQQLIGYLMKETKHKKIQLYILLHM